MSHYSAKRALLGSIIDYAGTFPPAALPLPEALKVAATYRRTGRHSWLMGKIALPLDDLKKLTAAALFEAGADGAAWLYTALGSAIPTPEEALRTLEWDFRELRRCNTRGFNSSMRQWILAYEAKVPNELLTEKGAGLRAYLDKFAVLSGFQQDVFLEFAVGPQWADNITFAAGQLAEWCEEKSGTEWAPGLKFRTGGQQVPTAEALAHAIATTASHGLRFKATQGLHAAVTHDGNNYGFVNLFTALAFSYALGEGEFDRTAIARCLADEDAAAFRFDGKTLHYRDFKLDADAIEAARRRHGATFGSCSLDEPDESLSSTFKE